MPTDWKALLEIVRKRTPDVWRIAGGPENPTHYTISSFHETLGYQIHSMQWIKNLWPDTYEAMKPTYIKDAAAIVVAVNHFEAAVAAAMATEAEIEKRVHDRIGHIVEDCRELTNQRDQLQRDLDAALTVMANHDLSLGDAIKMPLKQDAQIIELTRQRDELLAACEACVEQLSPSSIASVVIPPSAVPYSIKLAKDVLAKVKGETDG